MVPKNLPSWGKKGIMKKDFRFSNYRYCPPLFLEIVFNVTESLFFFIKLNLYIFIEKWSREIQAGSNSLCNYFLKTEFLGV